MSQHPERNHTTLFDQDLVLANIFLYLHPNELFNNSKSSPCPCRNVCRSWNNLIGGEEFCKYYFENSFCFNSSETFVNNQNFHQLFDTLDDESFDYLMEDDEDEEDEELDEHDEDDDDEDIEPKEKPIQKLTIQESITQFEYVAISKIGHGFDNLQWKSNFYKRLLTLVAYLTNKDDTIYETIVSLLKPLDDSKLFKLNNLLKKWNLSKLLSCNIFGINENEIVFFNDDGIPHLLKYTGGRLILDTIDVMHNVRGVFGFRNERITVILPQLNDQQDQQVLCDVMCGLFPQLTEVRKKINIKRPLSAYLLYVKSMREKIKQENPTLTVVEISKLLQKNWKGMNDDDDEKEVYLEQGRQEKLKYLKQIEETVYCIRGLDEHVNDQNNDNN